MKHIIGICRFSLLGRGDWKAYRGKTDADVEAMTRDMALRLFAPARIDGRLASFRHLTLASLAAQTDQDFTFAVFASDEMPQVYRQQLEGICAAVPQVVLRFLPPTHVADAQAALMKEMGLPLHSILQFRLDDDDAVAQSYIETLRAHATTMHRYPAFAISYPNVLFCATGGTRPRTYTWNSPYFSAGVAVRHRRSIFCFGHYALPRRMIGLTDPALWSIATHRGDGDNDTPEITPQIQKARGMAVATREEIATLREKHFAYLAVEGRRLCGWTEEGNPGAPSGDAEVHLARDFPPPQGA